ncbi:MAG: zinc-ribbon domain-containing protein [Clostridia bacterium]
MQRPHPSACPRCGKSAPQTDARFCPYCGAELQPAASVPAQARAALDASQRETDPCKKHALLLAAERDFPDCMEIAQELLFLGRLYERNPRKLDYSVIKCHLLHFYLTPRDFSPQQQSAMRKELFEHPQLARCQALAPNAEAFTRAYLTRLSSEFVRIFLCGNSRYTRTIFGVSLGGRAGKQLAAPAAAMLAAIDADEQLPPQRREMLYAAFYAGCCKAFSGEAQWLLQALNQKELPVPTQP